MKKNIFNIFMNFSNKTLIDISQCISKYNRVAYNSNNFNYIHRLASSPCPIRCRWFCPCWRYSFCSVTKRIFSVWSCTCKGIFYKGITTTTRERSCSVASENARSSFVSSRSSQWRLSFLTSLVQSLVSRFNLSLSSFFYD